MGMDMKEIIARVPDYTCFMTVDELDQSTQKLASEYPDRVRFAVWDIRGQDIPFS